jgi:single-strand DNA-binding protein
MYETNVTVVGNLVDDPQLRTTPNGNKVANFRIASTARRRDRVTGEWGDGDSLFISVACWRDVATNVVQSIGKGDPVIVFGRIFTRVYERDGQARHTCEMDAVAVGPDLARGTASFQKSQKPPAARTEAAVAGSGARAPVLRMVSRDDGGPEDDAVGPGSLVSAAP